MVAIFSKYSLQILLVWLAAYLFVKLRGSGTFTKRFLLLSALGYVFVLLYMTLLSRGPHQQMRYQLELLWEYRQAFKLEAGKLRVENVEFVWYIANNILLFIPLGILLSEYYAPHCGSILLRGLATGCLVSVLLEIGQLVFRIGLFELDDILNNSIGALFGSCFYALAEKRKRRFQNRS